MASLGYDVPGTAEVQNFPWIQIQQVTNCALVLQLQAEVDAGESEAIVLAIERTADRLIIDDYRGRIVAARLGLRFIGLLGVLIVAKQRGLIAVIKPVMDDLIIRAGFRVSNQLYAELLRVAGE